MGFKHFEQRRRLLGMPSPLAHRSGADRWPPLQSARATALQTSKVDCHIIDLVRGSLYQHEAAGDGRASPIIVGTRHCSERIGAGGRGGL